MDTKTLEKANELACSIKNLKEKRSILNHLIKRTGESSKTAPLARLEIHYPDDAVRSIGLSAEEVALLYVLRDAWNESIQSLQSELEAL